MSHSILARAHDMSAELTALRRSLHQEPELSYQEQDTQRFLRRRLESVGFTCREVAGTGLLATPPAPASGRKGPIVALRAELDALPIQEANDVSYRSRRDGVMHACGHDAHMTMVFGAGQLLASMSDGLPGSFVLLFQPAEEVPPGGARRVLDEGVLADAGVTAIFGLHVDPRYPAGQILLRKGPLMAASDRFQITVIGKGGHGGYPHLAVDAVVTAAQIVVGLQSIVARRLDPMEAGVVSIGRIEGGSADNILPERVVLSGTLRSHSPDVRRQLPTWIHEIATGIAAGAGARVEFEYQPGHPGLSNDPATIDFLAGAFAAEFDAGQIVELTRPVMGGEDFAHYLEVLPGAFLRLGVRNEAGGIVHPLHNPQFNLDESALPVGAALLAIAARAWLTRSAAG